MRDKNIVKGQDERGSALVYILIAIALLAALTVSFMNPSSNQTTSQNTFKTVSEVQSQVDFVRSAIQECVLTYPGGDAGVIAFVSSHNYPIRPSDGYFDAQCGAGESAASDVMSGIRCPGNPGDNPCHTDIFGGNTGKFLPPAPALFNGWKYYNGDDGVFLWVDTARTDAFIDTVMDKLDSGFSLCEADIMRPTAGDFQMTSDLGAGMVCPDDSKCFRVWMKVQTDPAIGTPTYFGGTPEAASCP